MFTQDDRTLIKDELLKVPAYVKEHNLKQAHGVYAERDGDGEVHYCYLGVLLKMHGYTDEELIRASEAPLSVVTTGSEKQYDEWFYHTLQALGVPMSRELYNLITEMNDGNEYRFNEIGSHLKAILVDEYAYIDIKLDTVIARMKEQGNTVLRLHVFSWADERVNYFYNGLDEHERQLAFTCYQKLREEYGSVRIWYAIYRDETGELNEEVLEENCIISYNE